MWFGHSYSIAYQVHNLVFWLSSKGVWKYDHQGVVWSGAQIHFEMWGGHPAASIHFSDGGGGGGGAKVRNMPP